MAEYLENTTGKKPEEMTEVEKLNAGLNIISAGMTAWTL